MFILNHNSYYYIINSTYTLHHYYYHPLCTILLSLLPNDFQENIVFYENFCIINRCLLTKFGLDCLLQNKCSCENLGHVWLHSSLFIYFLDHLISLFHNDLFPVHLLLRIHIDQGTTKNSEFRHY